MQAVKRDDQPGPAGQQAIPEQLSVPCLAAADPAPQDGCYLPRGPESLGQDPSWPRIPGVHGQAASLSLRGRNDQDEPCATSVRVREWATPFVCLDR